MVSTFLRLADLCLRWCSFLNEVQSHSSSNRTSVQNLATAFGPNILRAKAEDPQSVTAGKRSRLSGPLGGPDGDLQTRFPAGAPLVQVLMLELIREHESLFAEAPPRGSARPPGGLQAAPHLQLSPCSRQLSLPLIHEGPRPPAESPQDGG